jgi:aldehyde:ferredoxin oxidoreductase
MKIGERIENLHRLINLARGRTEDKLPARFFSEPHCAGLFAGRNFTPEDFQRWLSGYYRLRGWDERGVPTPEKLAGLGLPGPRLCQL